MLAKANGGDEAEEAEKEKAESEAKAEAEEKEKKDKAAKASESGIPKDDQIMSASNVELIAKAVAADLGIMLHNAEEDTRLKALPVGMFKNLSPDASYEKDTEQRQRTNST